MIEIPKQLQDFNFTWLGGEDGKSPEVMGKGWQKQIHRINEPIFQSHIKAGENYGVQSNNSQITIDGKTYFLIIIDFDKKEFQDKVINQFPETFTTTSGSPKQCVHLWFASDNNKSFKILDEKAETLADIQGEGKQVVAPSSKHKSGSIYSVVKDIPIAFISYAEIEAILKPHDKIPKKKEKPIKQYIPKNLGQDITEQILDSISIEEALREVGIDTSKNPTECPFHSSKGGKCLGFNRETAHCFHCNRSWNKYSLIREAKNLSDKDTFEWFAEKAGMLDKLKESRKKFKTENKGTAVGLDKENLNAFTRRGQIELFWEKQPFYYDKSKMFWLWDKLNFKWILSDEIDFLNLIQEKLGIETIDGKTKGELETGFKQVGRKHKPKDINKSWVQFKERIYNLKTGESFEATPEYFVCNPIPWKVGETEDTPTIDKLFTEWVDEKYVNTLYEIIAYNICIDKFMQRIIALCGGGSNGKGTYIKLNYKFLGTENCVSSEIKALSEDKFEPACLFRKLLCVMGEVSHNDLRNTNQLKKLGGEDKISFQFKGKTPFTDDNTATCICLTNSMPITPDKSTGFYRKWLIIDFPNQFSQINKKIIEEIPDFEFENLAKKCLRILKEMYIKQEFTNEGDFEERARKYEEHSNPVMRFVEEFCEEEAGKMTTLRDFSNACNDYLKSRHLRIMNAIQIGKVLRNEGFIVGHRKIEFNGVDESAVVIVNFTLKTTRTTRTTTNPSDFYMKEVTGKMGSLGSLGSYFSEEIKQ